MAGENLTYPKELQTSDEGHWVMFDSYPTQFGGGESDQEWSIALPMSAQAMITTSEAIYAEQEGLGTVLTETSAEAAKALTPYFTSGKEVDVAQALSTIAESVTKTKGASIAEATVGNIIRKDDFLKRAIGGANVAVNPKMSLLYQGPGKFRKFTFEFPMIAKSSAESEIIRKIIANFRKATLPGYQDQHLGAAGSQTKMAGAGGTRKRGAGSNFFSFPNVFNIKFGHNGLNTSGTSYNDGGGNSRTPFRIARSVCNACVVNYAAAGVPFFFEDGAPFEIKMTLTFTETVIITKEDIDEGF
jgi:hypothetical protein